MTPYDTPDPVHATATPAKHDMLREMLADVNAKLHAIGETILEMQAHGDMHDEHVELARKARDLAGEAHAKVETLRKAG
jgi:hypothetical protein